MHFWSSSEGSGCEKEPYGLTLTPCGGCIEQYVGVHLSCWHLCLGTHCWGPPLVWLCLWQCGSKSEDLLVQFTLAPQGSQIGVCVVQHLLKRAWIGATLVVLVRPRAWAIVKFAIGHCSLNELGTLHRHRQLWCPEQAGETACSEDWMLKMPNWMGSEVATLPQWAR